MPNPILASFTGEEALGGGVKGLKSKKNSKSKMGLKGSDLDKHSAVEAKSSKGHWQGKITQTNAAKTEATALVDCDQHLLISGPEAHETETVTVTVTSLTGPSNPVTATVETEPLP